MAKSPVNAQSWLLLLAAICGQMPTGVFGQSLDTPLQPTKVEFKDCGLIEVIDDGEHRLGANERMFLIEDQWEFDRCALLLPNLPKIDFRSEMLLVIMSWKSRARTLKSVEDDNGTLVIRVDQQKPPRWSNGSYKPPDFMVFKLPAWPGPVRFEVNGRPQFTIVRGKTLEKRSAEIWEEFLRIRSGGEATMDQVFEYYQRRVPEMPRKEISQAIFPDLRTHVTSVTRQLDDDLFRELIDIRARPVIPRIFELFDTMGQHDDSLSNAYKAVVGIGGPEVVEHCERALKSWNPRSRHAAMLILRDMGLPETRSLAHAHLVDLQYEPVGRNAMTLLCRIGLKKADVPAMVQALGQIEKYFLTPPNERPDIGHTGGLGYEIMIGLGSLGASAEPGLSVLERLASNTEVPVTVRDNARETIERIRPRPVE